MRMAFGVLVAALLLSLSLYAMPPDPSEVPVYDFSSVHESIWVAIVVDRSGSMQNLPIVRARAQACATLGSLRSTAHFTLASFGESGSSWRSDWTQASPAAIEAGSAWIDGLTVFGTTQPDAGIASALAAPAPVADHTVVVLITDGDPDRGMNAAEGCITAAGDVPVFVLLVLRPDSPRASTSRAWGRRVAEETNGDCQEIAP